jgi:CarboxypepD_reg-like domain
MDKKALFFLLISQLLFAQNDTIIKGIVKAENVSVEGVHVVNLVNEKTTITNSKGEFSIEAKEDDLLVFSAIHLEYARKSISKLDYQTKSLTVIMTPKTNELDEVVLTEYTKINALDLGIIDYIPKKYTPAERRLYTAQSGVLDPLLNWISGRTNQLKKELEVEKKEGYLVLLNNMFDANYFQETLKIPELFIEGFKYYIVEEPEVVSPLLTNNKEQTSFILTKLAIEFNEFLKDEKK